ncbi:MAG: DUF4147 domain-containing protein [Pirellulaceae bacterium]
MSSSKARLRDDALAIWHAGVAAVDSQQLVRDVVHVEREKNDVQGERQWLDIAGTPVPFTSGSRLVVVGAGKAGAGMAAGLEEALGESVIEQLDLDGWVNVPADCVRQLKRIHLHAARPAGINEPSEEGVVGSGRILEMVGSLGAGDTCICLLSGGGSALLPAPTAGISLADKQQVTRLLSDAGANIQQLNTVRKQLSLIKGGGLARACHAGLLVTLVISDVLGDPLDMIASGPTVEDQSTADDALAVLEEFDPDGRSTPGAIISLLRDASGTRPLEMSTESQLFHHVIGNNKAAVEAAGEEAVRRGYAVELEANQQLEGTAEEVGTRLSGWLGSLPADQQPRCLVSGGEPVVQLVDPEHRGRGGRNQQLVLAALVDQLAQGVRLEDAVILSAGTDGEDGPTDAAGAWIDQSLIEKVLQQDQDARDFLARNDAYTFFDSLGSLLHTGPTHTNVCDLRIVLSGAPG